MCDCTLGEILIGHTMQNTATYCKTLQHITTYCKTLTYEGILCYRMEPVYVLEREEDRVFQN